MIPEKEQDDFSWRTEVTLFEQAQAGCAASLNELMQQQGVILIVVKRQRRTNSKRDQVALGIQEPALAEISRQMVDFIGAHTWEELCQEWVLRAGANGASPFMPDGVGSAWNKQFQIDVAGINRMEKTLILGECKWGQNAIERPVLSNLVEKASQIVPPQGKWRVYFLGFSRSGWTSGAYAFRDEIEKMPISGGNWQSVGMRLLDLDQVDHDLERRSG